MRSLPTGVYVIQGLQGPDWRSKAADFVAGVSALCLFFALILVVVLGWNWVNHFGAVDHCPIGFDQWGGPLSCDGIWLKGTIAEYYRMAFGYLKWAAPASLPAIWAIVDWFRDDA